MDRGKGGREAERQGGREAGRQGGAEGEVRRVGRRREGSRITIEGREGGRKEAEMRGSQLSTHKIRNTASQLS